MVILIYKTIYDKRLTFLYMHQAEFKHPYS